MLCKLLKQENDNRKNISKLILEVAFLKILKPDASKLILDPSTLIMHLLVSGWEFCITNFRASKLNPESTFCALQDPGSLPTWSIEYCLQPYKTTNPGTLTENLKIFLLSSHCPRHLNTDSGACRAQKCSYRIIIGVGKTKIQNSFFRTRRRYLSVARFHKNEL